MLHRTSIFILVSVRAYTVVDVFTGSYRGNPVAVVLDGSGLATEHDAALRAWTNLSETTFVLPASTPQADYRVRIFTPSRRAAVRRPSDARHLPRLAGAGSPRREASEIVQECGAGLVRIRARRRATSRSQRRR